MVDTVNLDEASAPDAATPTGAGTEVNLIAGNGGGTSGPGGAVNISGGSALGGSDAGGAVNITSGTASAGDGGDIEIGAGNSLEGGNGGDVNITAGNASDEEGSGVGGDVTIAGGGASGEDCAAGFASLQGGSSVDGPGGFAELGGGSSGALDGIPGDIYLTVGQNASGAFGQLVVIRGLQAFADDAAAEAGGVPVGGLYRTASAIKIRVA